MGKLSALLDGVNKASASIKASQAKRAGQKWYHGTGADVKEIDLNKASKTAAFGPGFYASLDPSDASRWAGKGPGANVMPLDIDDADILKMAPLSEDAAAKISRYIGRKVNAGDAPPYLSLEKRGGSVSEGAAAAGFAGVEHAGPSGITNVVITDTSKVNFQFAQPLPMTQAARMERARDFHKEPIVYHGTGEDIESFDPLVRGRTTKAQSAKDAFWMADNPDTAAGYADLAAEHNVQKLLDEYMQAENAGDWDRAHDLMVQAEKLDAIPEKGQNVMPLRVKGRFMEYDAEGRWMQDLDESQLSALVTQAKSEGYDGLKITNFSDEAAYGVDRPATHYAVFKPENIRSVNAAFDPAKKDSANLLASAAGVGVLGAAGSGDADASAPQPLTGPTQRTRKPSTRNDAFLAEALGVIERVADKPLQGYLGISRLLGGLTAGEDFDFALNAAVRDATRPTDQTTFELGGALSDKLHGTPLAPIAPAVGTALHTGLLIGSPL